MKLIKINTDHYVVVDETIQPVNGYYYDSFINKIKNTNGAQYGEARHCWQITHSTLEGTLEDYEKHGFKGLPKAISLQEVKELIGEVDVEKKSYTFIREIGGTQEQHLAYIDGYREALEDNKEKKYTEEQMWRMFMSGHGLKSAIEMKMIEDKPVGDIFKELLKRYDHKTEWEVEFVDGKLKLL